MALLSAVETVNPKISPRSTLQRCARWPTAGRLLAESSTVRWPSTTAVSVKAANIKELVSPVAGQADILVVPDLESGNMLAKQLEYLADAHPAGLVLGARVPIILTSRADNQRAGRVWPPVESPWLPTRRCRSISVDKRHERFHPRSECRLVKRQILGVRGARTAGEQGLVCDGEFDGIGHRVHFVARDSSGKPLADQH